MSDQPEMDYDTALAGLVEGAEREVALFNKLAEIGRHFAGATSDIEQRQNALAALEVIIKHCIAADTGKDTGQTIVVFQSLYADIENLNEGREVVFLKPRPTDNRRERAQQDEVALAYAAAAIDHLIDHGSPPDEAARQVVREMTRRKIPLRPQNKKSKTTSEKSLLDHRKALRSGRRSKSARNAYDTARGIIASKDPKEALRIVFETISPYTSKVS